MTSLSSSIAVVLPRRLSRPARAAVSRRGLTLVELLVVMVILTILSSLMLSGLLVAQNRSKEVKTIATIRKLSEIILPYYEEYETRRPALDELAVSRIVANNSPRNREQLAEYKRIALRRLMALELPDRVRDLTDILSELNGGSPFQADLPDIGNPPLREIPPVTRRYLYLINEASSDVTSSDLLHMIVTRGVVADPDIIAHFRDDEVRDTNSNGLKEFIDGWGNPIYFKRWPVGFASPLQPITGTLADIDSLVSTSGHRLLPLIFSAGRDQSPDIEAGEVSYRANQYDPFSRVTGESGGLRFTPGQTVKGEVYLSTEIPTPNPVPNSDQTVEVFTAVVADDDEDLDGAFYTIGSPHDTNGNGRLESADNIHNHDLRQ